MTAKLPHDGAYSSARRASGLSVACFSSSVGPNIQNVTNAPDGDEGEQLDDRLGRDREDQAVLVLGRVGVARAEQHGEHRHRKRHDQRHVADHRLHRAGGAHDTVSSDDATAFSCRAM